MKLLLTCGLSFSNTLLLVVALCIAFLALCVIFDGKNPSERGGLLNLKHKPLMYFCCSLLVLQPVLLLMYAAFVPLDIHHDLIRIAVRAMIFIFANAAAIALFILDATLCLGAKLVIESHCSKSSSTSA